MTTFENTTYLRKITNINELNPYVEYELVCKFGRVRQKYVGTFEILFYTYYPGLERTLLSGYNPDETFGIEIKPLSLYIKFKEQGKNNPQFLLKFKGVVGNNYDYGVILWIIVETDVNNVFGDITSINRVPIAQNDSVIINNIDAEVPKNELESIERAIQVTIDNIAKKRAPMQKNDVPIQDILKYLFIESININPPQHGGRRKKRTKSTKRKRKRHQRRRMSRRN